MLSTTLFSRASASTLSFSRHASTLASKNAKHRIVVVGAGSAGIAVATQLFKAFKSEKRPLQDGDIAIVDPSVLHHYQPGWTLVGSGLAEMPSMSRPTASIIPAGARYYPVAVTEFSPTTNSLTTSDVSTISYDYLVVAPGISSNFSAIPGLVEGLADPKSSVTSIYDFKSVEKTWNAIKGFKGGKAIFTQPATPIKCAGAPQKIMWMALSQWKKDGIRDSVVPTFARGTPSMFGVPKYSAALEKLRLERNVSGLFNHNLISIDNSNKLATFSKPDGTQVVESFDLLHVVPPQGPLAFIKNSPLADAAGWVSVSPSTTQHTRYPNIFALGDASSMPNSKTVAAITAQTPVLVDNLRASMDGKALLASYDGYASCPLLTGHNELMLAEFKYGGIPSETFAWIAGSQDKPSRFFYWLKTDFFPWVYWTAFLKGNWFGPRGPIRPIAYMKE